MSCPTVILFSEQCSLLIPDSFKHSTHPHNNAHSQRIVLTLHNIKHTIIKVGFHERFSMVQLRVWEAPYVYTMFKTTHNKFTLFPKTHLQNTQNAPPELSVDTQESVHETGP